MNLDSLAIDNDDYILNLDCTICLQNLNHDAYKICKHPRMDVPICIVCYNDIAAENDYDDACTWCGDGGELFICDEEGCSNSFCKDCIEKNLGIDLLNEIEKTSPWRCLVCNPTLLQKYHVAMNECNSKRVSIIIDDENIDNVKERLNIFQCEVDKAEAMLAEKSLEDKKLEFRQDLLTTSESDIDKILDEEMKNYCSVWSRHHEIMQCQLFDLLEVYEQLGGDQKIWLQEYTTLNRNLDDIDIQKIETREMPPSEWNDIMNDVLQLSESQHLIRKEAEKVIDKRYNEIKEESDKMTVDVEEDYEEETDAIPQENSHLISMKNLANADEKIQKYKNNKEFFENNRRLWPKSFENAIPYEVLMSMYLARKSLNFNDLQDIVERYCIPQYVAVVLKYATSEDPSQSRFDQLNYDVPRSVLKALILADSIVESQLLYEAYPTRIPASAVQIEDFGSAHEVCETHKKYGLGSSGNRGRLTQLDIAESTAMEDSALAKAFEKKRKGDRSDGNEGATSPRSHTNVVNPWLAINRTEEEDTLEDLNAATLDRISRNGGSSTRNLKRKRKLSNEIRPHRLRPPESFRQLLHQSDATSTVISSPFNGQSNTNTTYNFTSSSPVSESESSVSDSSEGSDLVNDLLNKSSKYRLWKPTQTSPECSPRDSLVSDVNKSTHLDATIGGGHRLMKVTSNGNVIESSNIISKTMKSTSKPTEEVTVCNSKKDKKRKGHDDNDDDDDDYNSNAEMSPVPILNDDSKKKKKQIPILSTIKSMDIVDLTSSNDDDSDHDDDKQSKANNIISKPAASAKHPINLHSLFNSRKISTKSSPPSIKEQDSFQVVDDDEVDIVEYVPSRKSTSSISVSEETKKAQKDAKLAELRRKTYSSSYSFLRTTTPVTSKIVSAESEDDESGFIINELCPKGDPPIRMHSRLSAQLKPHQVEAVQFMWMNVVDSVKMIKDVKDKGGGCIIAHCMGLGKTFSVISFIITLLTNRVIIEIYDENHEDSPPPINIAQSLSPSMTLSSVHAKKRFSRILVLAPVNTIENWEQEFKKWTPKCYWESTVFVRSILSSKNKSRQNSKSPKEQRSIDLHRWFHHGGVLIISYEMFRIMTANKLEGENKTNNSPDTSKKLSSEVLLARKYLLDPGPDLIVADEAHVIKNAKSNLTKLLCMIRTRRRIALTGSPLQNNLEEYHCMVDFVRPRYLGSLKEYRKIFVNPIRIGENKDATKAERNAMRRKTFVLHKKLKKVVNRKDDSVLEEDPDFPRKREFILILKMSEFQKFLYKTFMLKLSKLALKTVLFKAYQSLLRVWNHPMCLVKYCRKKDNVIEKKKESFTRLISSKVDPQLKLLTQELSSTYSVFCNQGISLSQDLDNELETLTEKLLDEFVSDDEDVEVVKDSTTNADNDLDDGYNGIEISDDQSGEEIVVGDAECNVIGQVAKISALDTAFVTETMDIKSTATLYNGFSESTNKVSIIAETLPQNENKENVAPGYYVGLETAAAATSLELDEDDGALDNVLDSGEGETVARGNEGGGEVEEEEDAIENELLGNDWWKLYDNNSNDGGDDSLSVNDMLRLGNKSLAVLDFLEDILQSENWCDLLTTTNNNNEIGNIPLITKKYEFSNWKSGIHYQRIDGNTKRRQGMIDKFNTKDQCKLFLVSTKAGNMGVNLVAANRVIIFDCSWNPAHDLQAIYRCYRYGQKKPVFVYRFLAAGSMEEKIYKLQVTKMSLSARVVDAQMPDNHFTAEERAKLLSFNFNEDPPMPLQEALAVVSSCQTYGLHDNVLKQVLLQHGVEILHSLKDQAPLLEDKEDEHLNDAEEKEAEEEYQREIAAPSFPVPAMVVGTTISLANVATVGGSAATSSVSIIATNNTELTRNTPIDTNNRNSSNNISAKPFIGIESSLLHNTNSTAIVNNSNSFPISNDGTLVDSVRYIDPFKSIVVTNPVAGNSTDALNNILLPMGSPVSPSTLGPTPTTTWISTNKSTPIQPNNLTNESKFRYGNPDAYGSIR